MTKKHYLTGLFISSLILSSFHSLYAQKDSSTQVTQISFEASNVFELKQKILNNPSLSMFAPIFNNIDQLKKSNYTITGAEDFPPKFRKRLVKKSRKGVGLIIEMFDNPEKENNLLAKL